MIVIGFDEETMLFILQAEEELEDGFWDSIFDVLDIEDIYPSISRR